MQKWCRYNHLKHFPQRSQRKHHRCVSVQRRVRTQRRKRNLSVVRFHLLSGFLQILDLCLETLEQHCILNNRYKPDKPEEGGNRKIAAYTRFPFRSSSLLMGRILTTTLTVSSALASMFTIRVRLSPPLF